MISLRSSKSAWIFIALLVLLSFVSLFFHHHHDGLEQHECPACRMVQAFSALLVLAVILFFGPVLSRTHWFPVSDQNFYSFLGTSSLQGRAPPIFSF